MLKLPFHSLQARFTLLIAAAATLFAAIAAPLIYTIGYERAIARSRVLLGDLSNAVEKTAAVAAYTSDRLLLQEVVDGVGRNGLVSRVEIRTAAGTAAGYGPAPSPGIPVTVTVERPLQSPFDPGETVGLLRIEASQAVLDAVARRQALTLVAFMAVMVVVITSILYAAAQFYISRPIVGVAYELRLMNPGTSSRLAAPPGHADDEIGMLVSAANAALTSNEVAMRRERRLRDEVAAMEAQYRKIFDSASAGIFVLDRHGHLVNANPAVLKVIGAPAREIRQLPNEDFVRRVFAEPQRVLGMIREAADTGQTVSADLELLSWSAEPARWVHCLISVQGTGETGPQPAVADMTEAVIYDITNRKRQESEVRHQAEHDKLTGLKNRAAMEAALERFVADAKANDSKLALLYIDLDGFRRVNDARGHSVGDYVLREIAHRMRETVRRSSDLVGRFGGDRFMVVLNNCGVDDQITNSVAAGLLAALSRPVALDNGASVQLGASIGIAGFPHHGSAPGEIMLAADAAMYAVKHHGKNAFAVAV